MADQTTTQTQANRRSDEADLDPNQLSQGDDAALYRNADGAQSGGTRAFNANASDNDLPNVLQESAAMTGKTGTRTPHGEGQGITNHPLEVESARQEKVVSERPDAQAGVDLTGHSVPKDR